ncbi:MAG TPA: UDP-4-amino-4,6-dideoxy-N-acetyl-beta-L-altrosamine N-acetyltransferase [Nautiliaceae bacterium]|nr:UDP-4-amino-4,6-dideoxy-N-acetyl-beta-L-altrosamine N-acetyltransferase [Nautiliaceae bacterium]
MKLQRDGMKNKIKLINFINASLEEKKMILRWRNHPHIRKWMYNQKEISLDSHLNFIESLKSSKNKIYFLVKMDKEYIGVIDFTNIDYKNKSTYFGLYSNPYSKVPGIGRILEKIAIDYAFNTLNMNALKLEVFEDNKIVINLHKKFNFKQTGEKIVNNKKVIVMELKNENRKN